MLLHCRSRHPTASAVPLVRGWAALVLLLAVALAQQLGLMHRYAHLHGEGLHGHTVAATVGAEDTHEAHGLRWVKALVTEHDDESCALFDGATASGAPTEERTHSLLQFASSIATLTAAASRAARLLAFHARGPPPSTLGF